MPDNSLAIRVSATDETGPVLAKVGENVAKLKREAGGAGGDSGLKGDLAEEKKEFGRGSELREALESLKGAGPAIALGGATAELAAAGHAAKDLATQLGEGKISAKEIPLKLLEGLPVVGGIVSGVKDWALALSGISYMEAVIEKASEEEIERIKRKTELTRQLAEISLAGQEEVAQAKEEFDRSNLPDDLARQQKIVDDKKDAVAKANNEERLADQKAQDEYQKAQADRPQDHIENLLTLKKKVAADLAKQQADESAAQYDAMTKQTEQEKAQAQNLAKSKKEATRDQEKADGELEAGRLKAAADALEDGVAKIQAEFALRKQEIQNTLDAELAAIADKKAAQEKAFPDSANAAQAEDAAKAAIAAARAKAAQDTAAALAADHRDATAKNAENADKQIAGERELMNVREEGLRVAADAGNEQAKRALDLQQIQSKYLDDAEKLRKVLTDPASSDALKKQAAAELQGLQAEEKKALLAKQQADIKLQEPVKVDIPEDASHLTGNNLYNVNAQQDPSLDANKTTAAATKDLNDFFTNYILPMMPGMAQFFSTSSNPTGIVQP